ncbi:MAG TPA: pyridoxal phosphate-dependent aminotransferase, partial [Tetragenococcus sp.]|nr:pyridoxal phosphate-dependent aminotransferase [Tetragenococcus sp.]
DIVYQADNFVTFQNAADDFADFSIVLTAATKTFNLAGIKNSMIFIKNSKLRTRFSAVQKRNGQADINTFGMIGTEVAYNTGEDWLDELLVYLKGNIDFASDFLTKKLPKVKFYKPAATYLMWLDFSAYGLSDEALAEKMIHQAKLVLNPGIAFGPHGTQHMRLNLACPRATVVEGLKRMAQVF